MSKLGESSNAHKLSINSVEIIDTSSQLDRSNECNAQCDLSALNIHEDDVGKY